jgi:hypothetical protein
MKRHRSDRGEKDIFKRSATKWEYDLLQQENPNEMETTEKFVITAQREIRDRIQVAISKKLTR